ncbi:MAG: hypothetical protein GY853_16670 [PVC group bacterium]|nr:hypothetical protein [PVC group bacterium]
MKLLTNSELSMLKSLLDLYKGYDKLDLLIEQVVTPEYFTRKEIKEIKKEVISEVMPNEVMYCTSEKCEIDPLKAGGC